MLITKRLNFLDLDFDAGRQLASVSSQNGGCQRRQRRQMGGGKFARARVYGAWCRQRSLDGRPRSPPPHIFPAMDLFIDFFMFFMFSSEGNR